MIRDDEELAVSQQRLGELRVRVERIVADPVKSRRVKDMELAGVQGMIAQIEKDILSYSLSQLQQSIHGLRNELHTHESPDLPGALSRTLGLLEEVTRILQPVGQGGASRSSAAPNSAPRSRIRLAR